ncbi:hypothetical protein BGK72_00415 [Streptomyces agglomeratus]|nr:hypothetical protein BGK72_00415 [Streptomyces agglomeratus]
MNWRGRPLNSHDVIVNSIAATTTRTGLSVEAALDTGTYYTGVKVTDAQIDALPMDRQPPLPRRLELHASSPRGPGHQRRDREHPR